jgi:O-antigen/teichoic acid export membrane protein
MLKQLPVFNLALRGITLFSRFILIFYIGKYFSTEELGIFGLFSTTITLSIFLLGYDFYAFNTREILNRKPEDRFVLIRDQLIFHALLYIVVLPLLGLIFLYKVLPVNYILLFYVILIFEHFSQEFYRLFIVLEKPVFSNFLLFIRSGVWVYILLILWLSGSGEFENLQAIFMAWAGGVAISCFLGFFFLFKYVPFSDEKIPVDWKWIKKGILISTPFFIGTIAYKIIEFSDRYMIDFFLDKSAVGVYTFYNNISNLINVTVDTMVIIFLYPKLIDFANKKDLGSFLSVKQKMTKQILFVSLITTVLLGVLLNPLLIFLEKEEFENEKVVFYIMLLSNIVLNISFIAHYVLYSLKKDMAILFPTITGAIINIILNIMLIKHFGLIGAATATLISFFVILALKHFYFSKENLQLLFFKKDK